MVLNEQEAKLNVTDFSGLGVGYDNQPDYAHNWSPIGIDNILIKKYSGYLSLGNFVITTELYDYNDNWVQIVENLSSEYKVADWEYLKNYYNAGGDFLALFDRLGLTECGDTVFVTRSGNQFYSSDRAYYASRHEHNKSDYYLVHYKFRILAFFTQDIND